MKYQIKCLKCGAMYDQDEYVTSCRNGCQSFLKTEYTDKQFTKIDQPGIWQFSNWLPFLELNSAVLNHTSASNVYRSQGLSEYLGINNLIIARNTYADKDKKMITDTFKDIEAEMAYLRLLSTKQKDKPFLVVSDGNIATSFIYYANVFKHLTIVVAPEEARINRIWSYYQNNPYVKLITVEDGDYYDAIALTKELGKSDQLIAEGGSKNVARRDGVGAIMIEASLILNKLPDHYFQALGSGPGAIAMFETSQRLVEDGRFGDKLPQIYGSQNYPFDPMADAWQNESRIIDPKYQGNQAKELIKQVKAQVLTNRFPAYSITGGVYDALKAVNGQFYSITNQEIDTARALFKECEGYAIGPESGVTVASLLKARKESKIDNVLVNITGGDKKNIKARRYQVKPIFRANLETKAEEVLRAIL